MEQNVKAREATFKDLTQCALKIKTLVQIDIFVALEQSVWPTVSIPSVSSTLISFSELNSADTDSVFVFYLFWGTIHQLWPQSRCYGQTGSPKRLCTWSSGSPESHSWSEQLHVLFSFLGHCQQKGAEQLFWKYNPGVVNSLLLSKLISGFALIKVFQD